MEFSRHRYLKAHKGTCCHNHTNDDIVIILIIIVINVIIIVIVITIIITTSNLRLLVCFPLLREASFCQRNITPCELRC